MFKETIENNAEVKANTKELEALKKHFPSCFDKEGNFDIKIFEELIKTEEVDIKKEGYALNFLGKSYARYLSSLDSETVIVPDENNNDIDSENIYIVGDNLDALQHLKYSYSEKIKCIYIDPPYNTGSDGFVYNDKFEFTAEELAKKINIEDDEAERILNMQGKSTHSAWLTFMYPRLELAKELLSDDGVIFISIDDNEQANLKKLCDEIFGESNFISTLTVENNPKGRKNSSFVSVSSEFCLIYCKNKEIGEFMENIPKNVSDMTLDEDGKYVHNSGKRVLVGENNFNNMVTNFSSDKHYSVYYNRETKDMIIKKEDDIDFIDLNLINDNYIRYITYRDNKFVENTYTEAKIRELYGEKKLEFKEEKIYEKNFNSSIRIKSILNNRKYDAIINNEVVPFELDLKTTSAKQDLDELFGISIFDYPKNISFIKTLITLCVGSNDIILDFFSGSATTAHAVMQLNAEEGGNRKFIMVQLPEETDEKSEAHKAGYKTIDEIGRERIRRAAAKIKEEEPEKSKDVDLGFKTYYLQDIDSNTLDKIREFNPDMPIDAKEIQDKFGKDAIIETWKIRDGFGFNASLEEINLSGYTAYKVSDSKVGVYLYLLDDMESEAIQELVRQLEAFELNVDKIIEYGYSFSYNANTALRANLKTLKNKNAIDVLIRY